MYRRNLGHAIDADLADTRMVLLAGARFKKHAVGREAV